jgi:hypothetical protein
LLSLVVQSRLDIFHEHFATQEDDEARRITMLYIYAIMLVIPLTNIKCVREHKITPLLIAAHFIVVAVADSIRSYVPISEFAEEILFFYDLGVIMFFATIMVEDCTTHFSTVR